jgi:TadE-like protein
MNPNSWWAPSPLRFEPHQSVLPNQQAGSGTPTPPAGFANRNDRSVPQQTPRSVLRWRKRWKASASALQRKRIAELGATIVEVALVFPLLLGIIFAIMEISSMAAARSTVSSASATAARVGAISANDPDSDLAILKALRSGLGDHAAQARYVIVFNAPGFTSNRPPEDCITEAESGGSGVSGQCNIYRTETLMNPTAEDFGYSGVDSPALADKFWPALTRRTTYLGGRDNVGVYVTCDLTTLTGLVPATRFEASSVVRLEARDV